MTSTTDLVPVVSLIDKDTVEATLGQLAKGDDIASTILANITEVTADNREAVIADLEKIKRIHDKIKLIRTPLTQWLDDKKKQLMSFERASDYTDKGSEYTKKRDLVQAFDQKVLEETRKKEFAAEHGKKINIYKAELKAAVQRQLVDMMASKKRMVIESLANWKASLTLETYDAKVNGLTAKKPLLPAADYDKCFNTNFQVGNMVTTDEEGLIQNSGYSLDEQKKKRAEINLAHHQVYFEALKVELPYSGYNDEYVRETSILLNEVRAELPGIKTQLEAAKTNAKAEEERQASIKAQAAAQVQAVEVGKAEQLTLVADAKDQDVMSANFEQQAMVNDLAAVPTKKIVRFVTGQFIKPFTAIVGRVAAHPDFPGILKKGKQEYIDSVQWWVNWYQTKCQLEENGKPLIDGIELTEEAKTTIRAK